MQLAVVVVTRIFAAAVDCPLDRLDAAGQWGHDTALLALHLQLKSEH